jgi:hypothetical protein
MKGVRGAVPEYRPEPIPLPGVPSCPPPGRVVRGLTATTMLLEPDSLTVQEASRPRLTRLSSLALANARIPLFCPFSQRHYGESEAFCLARPLLYQWSSCKRLDHTLAFSSRRTAQQSGRVARQ